MLYTRNVLPPTSAVIALERSPHVNSTSPVYYIVTDNENTLTLWCVIIRVVYMLRH